MGKLAKQIRAEFRQLPLMLGKVLGGFAAVGGFMMVVMTLTRTSTSSAGSVLPSVLVGVAGVVVFILSGRALTRRAALPDEARACHRMSVSLVSWALLLLFVLFFLAGTWFFTNC